MNSPPPSWQEQQNEQFNGGTGRIGIDAPIFPNLRTTRSADDGRLSLTSSRSRSRSLDHPLSRYDMEDFGSFLFESPKHKRSHHRNISGTTATMSLNSIASRALSPHATPKKIACRSRGAETPLTLPALLSPAAINLLLSPAAINNLLYSPSLERAYDALEEECKDIERASEALEEESRRLENESRDSSSSNIASSSSNNSGDRSVPRIVKREQTKISPLPSPTGKPHPLVRNLVSPEHLNSFTRKRKWQGSFTHPRTPPLKKRLLAAYPQQRNQEHQQQQNQDQSQRISLTAPNLLMGLKYPSSTSNYRTSSNSSVDASKIEENKRSSKSTSNTNHAKSERGKPLTRQLDRVTTSKTRKTTFGTVGFPLPSLKRTGRKTEEKTNKSNSDNGFVLKKAPSLEFFRRKWDSLSKRKGHISEHWMSESEQRRLLRESFGRAITR